MSNSDKTTFLAKLSESERAEFELVEQDATLVQQVLENNPEFDPHDLFQIAYRLRLSPEERLQLGLRRRVFGYAN